MRYPVGLVDEMDHVIRDEIARERREAAKARARSR
jgi:hypothetical protein